MNTIAIKPQTIECLGVCCDLHARCQHYANVDGSTPPPPLRAADVSGNENLRIGTCMTHDGYTLFSEINPPKGPTC